MRLDTSFAPQPWLAESLTANDDKAWTLTLRDGATFQDGTPVTAEAVKASLDRAVERIVTAKGLFTGVTVAVKDERTLTFTTATLVPSLPGILTEPSFTIVNAAAAQAQGDAFAQKPVLTGPFMVESFEANRQAILVRNIHYWSTTPKAERVEITALSDANARMLGLQSGEADIAIDIRPESVDVIQGDANLKVVPAQPVATMFMYINQKKPVWQDLRVRQALAYALPPRDVLLKTVLRGQGVAGVGPIPPAVLSCDNLKPLPNDLEKAKALLAETGYTDTNDDGYVDKDGQTLSMLVISYPQRPALTPMAEIIQANLKDIGIQMTIESTEQINDRLTKDDWAGAMYFNNMGSTGDPYGSLSNFYTEKGSSNRGGYKNAAVEAQIAELGPVQDRADRLQRACQISQALLDDVAILPLVYPNYSYGVSKKVTGFDQAHPYFLYFLNGDMGIS
ncbi:MAG: ABC transporter substrate-binding protein [Chloroflexales bacterium]|nr:ABC transporter substrate-binding protein [Chloroflexales bacterium]